MSPFPIASSVVPLCVILAITALKEGREDYKRHQADDEANSRTYMAIRDSEKEIEAPPTSPIDGLRNGLRSIRFRRGEASQTHLLGSSKTPRLQRGASGVHITEVSSRRGGAGAGAVTGAGALTPSMTSRTPGTAGAVVGLSNIPALTLPASSMSSSAVDAAAIGQAPSPIVVSVAPPHSLTATAAAAGGSAPTTTTMTTMTTTGAGDSPMTPLKRQISGTGMSPGLGPRPLSLATTPSRPHSGGGGGLNRMHSFSINPTKSAKLTSDEMKFVDKLQSRDIKIGQIIRVFKDQEFPADMLLLSSSSPDGICFVNTANLDGEAVPKPKNAPTATMELKSIQDFSTLKGEVIAQAPSADMHEYKGSMRLVHHQGFTDPTSPDEIQNGRRLVSLSQRQILLRGSSLANTEYVTGIVVYTGPDTKMMKNRSKARFKFSRFESNLNRFIIFLMVFNAIVCILMALLATVTKQQWSAYFGIDDHGFVGWLMSFFTHYVLFSWMIPISLYVTIELVKVGQAQFMEWDNAMSWIDPDLPNSEPRHMKVNASSLNEELGNIDYVFTDKTGTLTQNKMELFRLSIAGQLFQHVIERLQKAPTSPVTDLSLVSADEGLGPNNSTTSSSSASSSTSSPSHQNHNHHQKQKQQPNGSPANASVLDDPHLPSVENLAEATYLHMPFPFLTTPPVDDTFAPVSPPPHVVAKNDKQRERQLMFAYNLLLNCSISTLDNRETGFWSFQSQSPDEIALCESLAKAGLVRLSTSGDQIEILCTEAIHGSFELTDAAIAYSARRKPPTTAPPPPPPKPVEKSGLAGLGGGLLNMMNKVVGRDRTASQIGGDPSNSAASAPGATVGVTSSAAGGQAAGAAPGVASGTGAGAGAGVGTGSAGASDAVNRRSSMDGRRRGASTLKSGPSASTAGKIVPTLSGSLPAAAAGGGGSSLVTSTSTSLTTATPPPVSPDGVAVTSSSSSSSPLDVASGQSFSSASASSTISGSIVSSASSSVISSTNTPSRDLEVGNGSTAPHESGFVTFAPNIATLRPPVTVDVGAGATDTLFDDEDDDDEMKHFAKPDALAVFTVLATLDFTSSRRRSDVVIRCGQNGPIYLLVKGADSTIFPMCSGRTEEEDRLLATTSEHASLFALRGSRTLVHAGRRLSEDEFSKWFGTYTTAINSMEDREKLVEEAFAQLEVDLELAGCTAVNDQLQEKVPETIDFLLTAGIKVVVLTGDKRETAETIAKECHIVQEGMKCLYVKSTRPLKPGEHTLSREEVKRITKRSLRGCVKYIKAMRKAHREAKQQAGAAAGAGSTYDSGMGAENSVSRPSVDPNQLMDEIAASGSVKKTKQPQRPNATTSSNIIDGITATSASLVTTSGSDIAPPLMGGSAIEMVSLSASLSNTTSATSTSLSSSPNDHMMHDILSPRTQTAFASANGNVVPMPRTDLVNASLYGVAEGQEEEDKEGEDDDDKDDDNDCLDDDDTAGDTASGSAAGSGDNDVPQFVIMLSGNTLQVALEYFRSRFIKLFLNSASIVTYRSTPKQKALVVELVKNELNHTCLAIGDGANDVSMIQEAHVGVGILGKEGSHAAMSSDYVLHRFAHLKQLVFVQGRYCLYRTAKVIMLSFYKNFVFVMPVVWFSFHNAFSGQVICSSYFMSVYNLLFTSLPPLAIGIFERDVPENMLNKIPTAYKSFKEQSMYTFKELFQWLTLSMLQSLVFYFFMLEVFYHNELSGVDGRTDDMWLGGSTLCFAIVITVNIILLFHVDHINYANIFSFSFGVVLFFLTYIVIALTWMLSLSPESYGVMARAMGSPKQWLYVILVTVLSLVIWHFWRVMRVTFAPQEYQLLQETAVLVREAEEREAAIAAAAAEKLALVAAGESVAVGQAQKHEEPQHQQQLELDGSLDDNNNNVTDQAQQV